MNIHANLVFGLLLLGAELPAQEHPGYKLVVNAGNPISSLPVREVSRLFQKKVTRWNNGGAVVPVDLPANSPVRVGFTRAVHGKSVSAIQAYWQRMIFSGRAIPPVEKASDGDVLAYVGANVNAIGYVSAGAPLGSNVKVLNITGGGGGGGG